MLGLSSDGWFWLAYYIGFANKTKTNMGIIEGRFIKDRRKKMGLTQIQLANDLGLSHAPIYHLENGSESISLKNLRLITDRLGLEVVIKDKDE
jgi:DNA-binding XRE family transcriptional regulator